MSSYRYRRCHEHLGKHRPGHRRGVGSGPGHDRPAARGWRVGGHPGPARLERPGGGARPGPTGRVRARRRDQPGGRGRRAGRRGGPGRRRAPDRGQLRGHRHRGPDHGPGRPVPAGILHPGDPGQPDRDVQRDPAGRVPDEPGRRGGRRAGRDRQHRVGRGVRGADRPGGLLRVQGGHRGYDASHRAGSGPAEDPGDDDRARPVQYAAPGQPARRGDHVAGRAGAASGAARRSAGVRRAGGPHRGEPDAQRGDDPAGRRDPDGAAVRCLPELCLPDLGRGA